MKNLFAVLAALLMLTVMLTACGDKKEDQATADSAAKESVAATAATTVSETTKTIAETTTVSETTANGSKIQKDGEGNVIEISTSGEVISIKDTRGNPRVISEYLEDHYFVTDEGVYYGNPEAGKKPEEGSGSQPDQPEDEKVNPTENDPAPDPAQDATESKPSSSDGTPDEYYELPFIPS